jgi:hypothetical protein
LLRGSYDDIDRTYQHSERLHRRIVAVVTTTIRLGAIHVYSPLSQNNHDADGGFGLLWTVFEVLRRQYSGNYARQQVSTKRDLSAMSSLLGRRHPNSQNDTQRQQSVLLPLQRVSVAFATLLLRFNRLSVDDSVNVNHRT